MTPDTGARQDSVRWASGMTFVSKARCRRDRKPGLGACAAGRFSSGLEAFDIVRLVTWQSRNARRRDGQVDGVFYVVTANTIVTICRKMKTKNRREVT